MRDFLALCSEKKGMPLSRFEDGNEAIKAVGEDIY